MPRLLIRKRNIHPDESRASVDFSSSTHDPIVETIITDVSDQIPAISQEPRDSFTNLLLLLFLSFQVETGCFLVAAVKLLGLI